MLLLVFSIQLKTLLVRFRHVIFVWIVLLKIDAIVLNCQVPKSKTKKFKNRGSALFASICLYDPNGLHMCAYVQQLLVKNTTRNRPRITRHQYKTV